MTFRGEMTDFLSFFSQAGASEALRLNLGVAVYASEMMTLRLCDADLYLWSSSYGPSRAEDDTHLRSESTRRAASTGV